MATTDKIGIGNVICNRMSERFKILSAKLNNFGEFINQVITIKTPGDNR
jgi:hypothetical protein